MLWLCIRLPALMREALAASEREAIERLAAWAYQWSSLVSYRLSGEADDEPRAPLLWLELGASGALFGGHAALLAQIKTDLTQLGYSHSCALAPSPTAAALLTRLSEGGEVFTRAQLRARLAPLPLGWLELPAATLSALQSAGLHSIGELLALPAAALARRFGPQICRYLARLTAAASDPRPAWRLPPVYRARCEFDHELHQTSGLLFPLQRLLLEFQGYLRARDCSVQRFTLELEHHRRAASSVSIGLCAPARAAAQFLRLVRERLHSLVLAAPVCALGLTACEFTSPSIGQLDYFGSEAQQLGELGELGELLDRLRARLGPDIAHGVQREADHRPERAWKAVAPEEPAGAAAASTAAAAASTAAAVASTTAARPCALLPSPRRIEAPPQLLSGPERIESGWWDGAPVARDYYVACAEGAAAGARLWVFRDLTDGSWYLQGLWV